MAIPDEKLAELREQWNLSEEILETLQAANAAEAEEGQKAGIEQKEKSDEGPPEEPETQTKDVPTEPQPEPEPEPEPEPGVTRAEMQAALEKIGQAIGALSEQVMAMKETVVEVKEQKTVEEALTLSEIFERAIGHPSTRVDGRTTEAKDRPAEHKEPLMFVNTGKPLEDMVINNLGKHLDWTK